MYTLIQQSLALEEYYGTAEDMGFITVYWDYSIAWEELLEKASSALSNLYKMDYQLWKRK